VSISWRRFADETSRSFCSLGPLAFCSGPIMYCRLPNFGQSERNTNTRGTFIFEYDLYTFTQVVLFSSIFRCPAKRG